PTGIAFALAAPVINPVVLISTYVAFASWEMVAWRAGLTFAIAVLVALLVGGTALREKVLAPLPETEHDHDHDHHGHHHHDDPNAPPLQRVLNHANVEFFEMVRYLIIGGLLAATLQTLVPQQALIALGDGRCSP
ncbi:permease, partial [Candidatus Gracilibacteria bacterium]|nr:permease [Candidatus Gracilibacteria bacterium]